MMVGPGDNDPETNVHPSWNSKPLSIWGQTVRLFLISLSILFIILFFPISIFFCIKSLTEHQKVVLLRLGKSQDDVPEGPGLLFLLPFVDVYYKVDTRTRSFDIPPQQALTRDVVTIQVDAVVFYRVACPATVFLEMDEFDYEEATSLLASTTLLNVLGARTLDEVLGEAEAISEEVLKALNEATNRWGILVEKVEISDLILPYHFQIPMAAEAKATRQAKAKQLTAEREKNSAVALKDAADILQGNPMSMQLRYLDTLKQMAEQSGTTIVLPLPLLVKKKIK